MIQRAGGRRKLCVVSGQLEASDRNRTKHKTNQLDHAMLNVSIQHHRSQAVSTMRIGIIYMLLFSFLLTSPSVALSPDGVALISLKALLTDPDDHLANWNISDADPCGWNGVKCQLEARRVHMLVLPSKRLRGSISPAIGKLDQLRRLSLHSNQLFGPIPKELGNCNALRYLYLQKNYLTGVIPAELGKLKLLKALNLASNGLTGNIPSSIGSLSRLDSFNVSSNYLLGKIPTNGVLVNFTLNSFLENPGLCGSQVNITCPSEPPAPAPDSELISVSSPPASPPISPPSYSRPLLGDKISPAPSMVSEAGGSIPEPLIRLKRNTVLLISAGCIALLSVLVCFWCWFLKTEYGTDQERNLKGYYGAKVVKFHGDLSYTSMDIIERTKLLDEKDMIGSGRFGPVYRLVMEDGSIFAVKKIGVLGLLSDAVFERELKILGSFKNRNLVNLRGYCISPSAKLLIYDHLPRGNLAASLHDRELHRRVVLNWATRMKIAIGTAQGLAHLHHACFPPIVHGDIKSSNILLDENLHAHLSDFGLAKLLEDNSSHHVSTIVAGTFGYLAPEYMDTGRVTQKGDVYSFGVVLLELLSGRRPSDPSLLAEGLNLVGWVTLCIKENIQCEIFDPKVSNGVPKEQLESVLKIAVMCINSVPDERPTMNTVVQLLETNSCGPSELTTNSHRSPHSDDEARGR